ncbi:histidine phosphatase family protein [Paenibacillus amylolyticus]|uniref:histidine phosphatase family protein n=1 Tax=Paenibacillus amylolyticus TaxID=1451 RepID=UPI001374E7D2|nr:histidine phosphatase family protein [Paenibacillus amylolyticus]
MVIKELEQLGSKQFSSKRSIVLIRHGTTQWNVEKKYLGHTDIGLLPDAQEELALLSEQCRNLTWDAVYCSDLLRCRQTLAHIAPQMIEQAAFDSRLRENHFGQWEGLNYEQLKDNLLYRSWIDDPRKVFPPEGEAWRTFAERVDSFLHEHIWSEHSHKNSHKTLIVTHGGVIRYMMSRLINGVGFWDTHVIPGQAIQVDLEKQGDHWLGRRVNFPYIGL